MRSSLPFAMLVGAALTCAGCAHTPGPDNSSASPAQTISTAHDDVAPSAHDFTPAFNITGRWIADGDVAHPSIYTQHGKEVTDLYDNGAFRHTQYGRFLDDHTLVTLQTRVNLATHATTRMTLTYIFDSPDHADVYWVALDSKADLSQGQTGETHIVREPR